MVVIAQLRWSRGLRLRDIPTGRVVKDYFCPAVIQDNATSDAKLPVVWQRTHCPFVTLPNQYRKQLARIRLVQIYECRRSLCPGSNVFAHYQPTNGFLLSDMVLGVCRSDCLSRGWRDGNQ